MALMNCPECNHQISDKAVSCPNCGFPLSNCSASIQKGDASTYAIVFDKINGQKIEVIKRVESAVGIDVTNAKELVDNFPSILKRNVPADEANRIKREIEKTGASIVLVPYDPNMSDEDVLKPYRSDSICCPRCSSTNVVIGQRGFSVLTGFLGSNKTVNRCGKCDYSWEPKI